MVSTRLLPGEQAVVVDAVEAFWAGRESADELADAEHHRGVAAKSLDSVVLMTAVARRRSREAVRLDNDCLCEWRIFTPLPSLKTYGWCIIRVKRCIRFRQMGYNGGPSRAEPRYGARKGRAEFSVFSERAPQAPAHCLLQDFGDGS
jgi:hypothetical protein